MSAALTDEERIARLVAFLAGRFPDGSQKYPKLTKHFWDEIDVLKEDKPRAVKLGKAMAKSAYGYERFFAYSLLGSVCNPIEDGEEPIGVDIAQVLSAAADKETNPALLQSLGYALGHAGTPAMRAIYELSFHADADVRYAATTAYGSGLDVDGDNLEPRYIRRIIELTRDTDPDVRDWATFTIAIQEPMVSITTDEILQALIARTRDRHFDTRSEAYVGLANRGDTSQITQFETWLAGHADAGPIGKLNIEAAGKFGSAALYESLLKIKEWWDVDDRLLQWALARCNPDALVRAKTPNEYDPHAEKLGRLNDNTAREEVRKHLRSTMPKDIYDAHKHSTNHRAEIERSKICGCFYCLATFTPNKIDEWINNDTEEFATCPKCGIDSVIGDASGYPINDEFLKEMHKYWFA